MIENPILALLSQLLGDFTGSPDANQSLFLRLAQALLQGQQPAQIRDTFEFERIQHYNTQYLSAEDRDFLRKMLEEGERLVAAQAPQQRVFLREMPFRATWLRSSIPAWARGAALTESLGPFKNRDSRRFWLDVYELMPSPRGVYFSGSNLPALVISSDTQLNILTAAGRITGVATQGSGNVWAQARLFVSDAEDDKYFGLQVADAELNITGPGFAINDHGRIVVQGNSPSMTLRMKLKTPEALVDENAAYGADARNAQLQLPESSELTIRKSGSTFNEVTDAFWKVFGSETRFRHSEDPVSYNRLLEALAIPMRPDIADFSVLEMASPALSLAGTTGLKDAAWLLPLAQLTSNVTFRAAGCGMLASNFGEGLSGSYMGLLDANEETRATMRLTRQNWLTLSPGHLEMLALPAQIEPAVQRLQLWQDAQGRWNDLQFRTNAELPFLYQIMASGTESAVSLSNCETNLDRPVGVNQKAIPLKTKNSLWARTHGTAQDLVLAYDENILRDNMPVNAAAFPPVSFKSQCIALNNALLTISPVNAFLLSGAIPAGTNQVNDAALLYAFALVGYLPALPDPYSGNMGLFTQMHQQARGENGAYQLSNVRRLLVSSMVWEAASPPRTGFIFGDMTAGIENQPLRLNPMDNLGRVLDLEIATRQNRANKAANRRGLHSGNPFNGQDNYWQGEYDISIDPNHRDQNFHFFSLLDVSTAADWMGVNLGFINDEYIFQRNFAIADDQNPISADGMDVVATGRLVRLFTAPQISWEPLINATQPTNFFRDPPAGILTFKDDGPPTLIGNTGKESVPIAPLPLAEYLVENYREHPEFKAWSFFSLPFGMLAMARYHQEVKVGNADPVPGAQISLVRHEFKGDIHTGLQISTLGYRHPQGNLNFEGATAQMFNLYGADGQPLDRSILSKTVTDIFNKEFGPNAGMLRQRGVPVERYDFSGYGANIFSHWLNAQAKIAETSQAKFDVWRGRTAHEVIQVRSLVYPWGIRVVRTITMFRNSAGMIYRIDSGWRAESDGVYDFRTIVKDKSNIDRLETNGYTFHSGMVKGVFKVRNIVESDDLAPFERDWLKTTGYHIDENDGLALPVGAGVTLKVELVPVYFDADVLIEDMVQGGTDGKVPSKRMLGYLQVAPRGVVISPELLSELLTMQNGLGGQVDCLVNIAGSNQTMRISRVEVQPSLDAGKVVFVTAAKGTPVLPNDGSWSVVAHKKSSDEVVPISGGVVPLIRRGIHGLPSANPVELANPGDLFNLNMEDRATQFAFLQNTDTQKVLYRNPWFETGKTMLQCSKPDMADAYRLLNSKGIFPKLAGLPRLDLGNFDLNIEAEGYKLLNKLDPEKALEQTLPEGPVYFINEKDIKIYVEYANKDILGVKKGDGTQVFDLDSKARKWVNKMNDITIVVDLLDMKRLFLIRGKFDTEKGKSPSFLGPQLEFGEDLQPVVDILQILMALNGKDYAGALSKGLKIAMSNSPNNWEYKFQADKEIPVLRFPPPIADSPVAPLRLEAYLKLGCYFNVGMPLPPDGLPAPSAGGFIEFGGKLSVMCLSVAAATVYAVGTVALRISADTVRGPGLYMKVGFGVELVVGLPVIGNVSVYFAAGVEISVDSRVIIVGAFILFRGRAELIGGLVTIQIQIEAKGMVKRTADRTDCIAQVTFSLDISIFLIINISFSKSFQEERQIA